MYLRQVSQPIKEKTLVPLQTSESSENSQRGKGVISFRLLKSSCCRKYKQNKHGDQL